MSNKKQKLARQEAKERREKAEALKEKQEKEQRTLQREFEGNAALEALFTWQCQKRKAKTKHQSHEEDSQFSLRELMAGVLGAGIGAFLNHVSSTRYIYFFVWPCVIIPAYYYFNIRHRGKIWRVGFAVCSFVLLLGIIIRFTSESPTGTTLTLNMRVGSGIGKPVALTNWYLMQEFDDSGIIVSSPGDESGFVVISVPFLSNSIPLFFGLEPSKNEVEGVSIKVLIPTNYSFDFDPDYWTEQEAYDRRFSGIATGDKKVNEIKAIVTKAINFNISKLATNEAVTMMASVVSTHSKKFGYAFNLLFVKVPGVNDFKRCPPPTVVHGFRHGDKFFLSVAGGFDTNGEWHIFPVDPYPRIDLNYH